MAVRKTNIPNFFIILLAITTIASGMYNSVGSSKSSIANSIKNSIVGTAKAESVFYSTAYNGDACWNASFTNSLAPCPTPADEFINICIKENDTNALPVYYYTSNSVLNSYYASNLDSTNITQFPITGLLINPVFQSTTTPYLTDFNRLNYLLNLTAPAVPFASSPILTTVNIDGNFSDSEGGTWNLSHQVAANVRMEHVNTGPTLSNLAPTNYSQTLASNGTTINLPVSVDYNDNENNQANLVFELSNDNFSTIQQTQTVNGVTAGTTVNTTFTNLGVGEYNWRVTATEIDGEGNCIGYANEDPPINLSAQDGPTAITLTSNSTNELASTGENQSVPVVIAILTTILGLLLLTTSKFINRKE